MCNMGDNCNNNLIYDFLQKCYVNNFLVTTVLKIIVIRLKTEKIFLYQNISVKANYKKQPKFICMNNEGKQYSSLFIFYILKCNK